MKRIIEVDIKKIGIMRMTGDVEKRFSKLVKVTDKTLRELCSHIDKYFKGKNVITKSTLKESK